MSLLICRTPAPALPPHAVPEVFSSVLGGQWHAVPEALGHKSSSPPDNAGSGYCAFGAAAGGFRKVGCCCIRIVGARQLGRSRTRRCAVLIEIEVEKLLRVMHPKAEPETRNPISPWGLWFRARKQHYGTKRAWP